MSNRELIEVVEQLQKDVAELKGQSLTIRLTMKEAVKHSGLTARVIYGLIAKREISGNKPGGKLLMINKSSLDKYLSKNPIASKDEINEIIERA